MTTPAERASPETYLLDGNVLVALVSTSHVHHEAAQRWFAAQRGDFATCPITQGALIRLLMRLGNLAREAAVSVLDAVTKHPRHRFWADSIGYQEIDWRGVLGHRQVTDAYLAALARQQGGRLATFDRGLAALHADVAVAIAGLSG